MPIVFINTPPLASIVFAFRQSNMVGQIIVALLFIGSIGAWSLMLIKIYELRIAARETARFLTAFRNETHVPALYEKSRRFPESPAFRVYEAVCRRWQTLVADASPGNSLLSGDAGLLTATDMGVLRGESEKVLAAQELALDDNMGHLATAVTAAPFLGLLGTVWGVMEAFIGMAMSGSAMLSAVAPGISAALLTTVVGLLVALPSLIGHNHLVNRIRRTTMVMDHFADTLITDIERQYGYGAGRPPPERD